MTRDPRCAAARQAKRRADKELRDHRHHAEGKLDDVATNLRKQVGATAAQGGGGRAAAPARVQGAARVAAPVCLGSVHGGTHCGTQHVMPRLMESYVMKSYATRPRRPQLKAKEDEVINLSSVHGALKAQYEKRLAELEEKCVRLSAANKQLEVRRYVF